MATFVIIRKGVDSLPILVLVKEAISSCQSKFTYNVTGEVGDSITLTFTDDTGKANYRYTVDADAILSVSVNNYTFISEGTNILTVYVDNTNLVETTQQTISAVNNTTSENDTDTTIRDSTGTPCI